MINLEIYDTTLREGEQSAVANFDLKDRIEICKMLDEFGVDYIELGWPIVSHEILNSFKPCMKVVKNAKVVAFGSTSIRKNLDEDKNLNSIIKSGVKVACIFGKSHLDHVEKQLKISSEENLKRIEKSIKFLIEHDIEVFYDAEHYFDAFKLHQDYAFKTLISAIKAGATRIILCDTNGGILPDEAEKIVKITKEKLEQEKLSPKFGVHFHNDCGLALANTLTTLPYIKQVQGTINGIGERVGNLNFSEFVPVYTKKMNCPLNINLRKLKSINEKVFKLAGIDVPEFRAFAGDMAFAHKGGVHTDATTKGASYEHENPEDFGNKTIILMNTLGGGSCIKAIAKEFGYKLDKKNQEVKEKIELLFKELRQLERKGYKIGAIKAEQFLLIEKYFGKLKNFFEIEEWNIKTNFINGIETSEFDMGYKINGKLEEESVRINGGPVNAAYKTFVKALSKDYPQIKELKLIDFHVSIAKSKGEESTVRTMITFKDGEIFATVGVDNNILQSAIEALVKGFRYYLNKNK